MANVSNGDSPEEYLVDYFGEGGPITVREASAADRVLITPLIVAPHDWQVLDSNALGNIYSTRYITQGMCNGLYRQYEEVRDGGRGNWFAARTDDGRVVGLATARLTEDDACRVDGFAHRRHTGAWPDLVGAATDWAQHRGAQDCFAMVCVEDEEKQAAFEELGLVRRRLARRSALARGRWARCGWSCSEGLPWRRAAFHRRCVHETVVLQESFESLIYGRRNLNRNSERPGEESKAAYYLADRNCRPWS